MSVLVIFSRKIKLIILISTILGKMLMEHETNKLKSQDEEYQRELREWKENLKPRKQVTQNCFAIFIIQYIETTIESQQ